MWHDMAGCLASVLPFRRSERLIAIAIVHKLTCGNWFSVVILGLVLKVGQPPNLIHIIHIVCIERIDSFRYRAGIDRAGSDPRVCHTGAILKDPLNPKDTITSTACGKALTWVSLLISIEEVKQFGAFLNYFGLPWWGSPPSIELGQVFEQEKEEDPVVQHQ